MLRHWVFAHPHETDMSGESAESVSCGRESRVCRSVFEMLSGGGASQAEKVEGGFPEGIWQE